jgi:SnoaL-like domain
MEKIDSVALVEQFWRDVWQSTDPEAIYRYVAEDFGITSGGIEIHSREEFKKWVAGFLANFVDFKFEVIESFQNLDGSRVASRWKVTAKNNGFLGTAPNREEIQMTGTAIWHVRPDGLLQHNWVERSSHEVYRSLTAS